MKRGYARRKLPESARATTQSVDKRVTCEICNLSFASRHYVRYHKQRCQENVQKKRKLLLPSMPSQPSKSAYESEEQMQTTFAEASISDHKPTARHPVPACIESVHLHKTHPAEYTTPNLNLPHMQGTGNSLSNSDMPSCATETAQDTDSDNSSEGEELWVETSAQSVTENMEAAIARDMDEVIEQASQPLTVQTKAQRFIKWLCLGLMVWQARYCMSDVAIDAWLHFFKYLLSVFAEPGGLLGLIATLIPCGMYGVYKVLGYAKDPFKKYVVCKKCFSLYQVNECLQQIEGRVESKKCAFVKYRWQKNALQRNACGEQLLKEVILPSGKKKLYPVKWFCYRSLKDSVAEMVMRPGFEDLCEKWRERNMPEGVWEDIMDGKIWNDLNGEKYDFFTQERSYGLMLNVDWFQPFKHVQYSVGAMYLTVMNLPKSERFKRQNVILVGIIPHMGKEPKINTFLSCLTEELKESWDYGFNLKSAKSNTVRNFRLALMLVSCDIPACRKVCGFLGHAAYRGCSKCWKYFPGQVGQRDYSGFSRENWPERLHATHVEATKKILDAKRKTDVDMLEREYGLRYSVLLELPYFDVVQMHVVDPMHNLFLGTAKRMIEMWKDLHVLTHEDMKSIQARVDDFRVPSDLGSIPYKIQSGCANFSADQWKNWTLYFSIPCLQGILPIQHLNVWKHFVKACYLFCSHIMAPDILLQADTEMMNFCRSFEALYGCAYVTPNIHLHGHLRECLMLYGPIYSYWLFSFERYNGILGNLPSNERSVEIQMMRRFWRDGSMFSKCSESTDGEKKLTECLLDMSRTRSRGSLQDMVAFDFYELCRTSSCRTAIDNIDISLDRIVLCTKKVIWDLPPAECLKLQSMYRTLYPAFQFNVIPFCLKIKQLTYSGDLLGVKGSRSSRSSFIMAYWPDDNGNILNDPGDHLELTGGQILYFIEHNIQFSDGTCKKHVLARVLWYQDIDPQFKNWHGFPVCTFYPNIYRPENSASFIPVQRIRCKMLTKIGTLKINSCSRDVLIAVPRDHFAGFQ